PRAGACRGQSWNASGLSVSARCTCSSTSSLGRARPELNWFASLCRPCLRNLATLILRWLAAAGRTWAEARDLLVEWWPVPEVLAALAEAPEGEPFELEVELGGIPGEVARWLNPLVLFRL